MSYFHSYKTKGINKSRFLQNACDNLHTCKSKIYSRIAFINKGLFKYGLFLKASKNPEKSKWAFGMKVKTASPKYCLTT